MIAGFSKTLGKKHLATLLRRDFMYIAVRSSIMLHNPNRKTIYTITPYRMMCWTLPILIADKMLYRMIGKTSAI